MKKIPISQLPLGATLKGLFTLGTDANNNSVKVSLTFVQEAAENCVSATEEANKATAAATKATDSANSAALKATEATTKATEATTNAIAATTSANNAAKSANAAAASANAAADRVDESITEITAEKQAALDAAAKANTAASDAIKATALAIEATGKANTATANANKATEDAINAENERKSAWATFFENATSGVVVVWNTWFTATKNAWESFKTSIDTMKTDCNKAISACEKQTALTLEINTHPNQVGDNGNWWIWNTEKDVYEDSGLVAKGGGMYPVNLQRRNHHIVRDDTSAFANRVSHRRNHFVIKYA